MVAGVGDDLIMAHWLDTCNHEEDAFAMQACCTPKPSIPSNRTTLMSTTRIRMNPITLACDRIRYAVRYAVRWIDFQLGCD